MTDTRTDLEFMKDASTWPLWPLLPIKNKQRDWKQQDGWPTLGTLANYKSGFEPEPIVYKESVDEMIVELRNPEFKPSILKRYASLAELVDDGWIVD